MANDIPKTADPLKDFAGRLRDPSTEEISEEGGFRPAYSTQWMLAIKELVQCWGESARRYVLAASEFGEMDIRYRTVPAMRRLLDSIADKNRKRCDGAALPASGDFLFEVPAEAVSLLDSLCLRYNDLKKHGTIEATGLLKILIDQAELDRIKSCAHEKCGKLFWAGRIDRPCCSERCRNAYKQKRHRLQQKQNRPYKKSLDRRKPNGRTCNAPGR